MSLDPIHSKEEEPWEWLYPQLSVRVDVGWHLVMKRVSLHSKGIRLDEVLARCNSFVASDHDDHEREREILET
jgi:hypothetical protein